MTDITEEELRQLGSFLDAMTKHLKEDSSIKEVMPRLVVAYREALKEIADTEGNKWMIATHKSEPTPAQMAEAMRQMSQSQPGAGEESAQAAAAGGSDSFGSEY